MYQCASHVIFMVLVTPDSKRMHSAFTLILARPSACNSMTRGYDVEKSLNVSSLFLILNTIVLFAFEYTEYKTSVISKAIKT